MSLGIAAGNHMWPRIQHVFTVLCLAERCGGGGSKALNQTPMLIRHSRHLPRREAAVSASRSQNPTSVLTCCINSRQGMLPKSVRPSLSMFGKEHGRA